MAIRSNNSASCVAYMSLNLRSRVRSPEDRAEKLMSSMLGFFRGFTEKQSILFILLVYSSHITLEETGACAY